MIYFIQAQRLRLIKIGYVERCDLEGVRQRLKAFQMGSPDRLKLVAVADGQKAYETQLHRRFKKGRVHGEWFGPSHELLNLIAALRMSYARKVLADLRTCGFTLRVDGPRLVVSPYSRFTSAWKALVQFARPELLELLNENPSREDEQRSEATQCGRVGATQL